MRYCVDLDGTLCHTEGMDYEDSVPYTDRIQKVNQLYDDGHYILIDTARGTKTGKDWTEVTVNQLKKWGVKYHEFRAGVKFYADVYIDDKAIKDTTFFKNLKIEK